MFHEQKWEGYLVNTDLGRLNLEVVHGFLKDSYWARGIPLETVERSVENSLYFGLYRGDEQIGFARVVTDRATFAYLADMFALEEHRGRGLGKWPMEVSSRIPSCRASRYGCRPPRRRTSSTVGARFRSLGAPRSSWRGRTPPSASERTDKTRSDRG